MAIETAAIEPKIKIAMKSIGLEDRADDLLNVLDEIELDIALKESIEQCDRGEKIPAEEVVKRIREKLSNGYYIK